MNHFFLIFRPWFCHLGANEVATRSFINAGGPKKAHSSLIWCLFKALVHSNLPPRWSWIINDVHSLCEMNLLIGSLSRTIEQYSPPSEWIMCELGVFPIFLENDLLKVDKILGLTFFKARKDLEGFKTAFFHLL